MCNVKKNNTSKIKFSLAKSNVVDYKKFNLIKINYNVQN